MTTSTRAPASTANSHPDDSALAHRKPCTLCSAPRDVLVRCQIDDSGTWHFVCPGSCWKRVSGGKIDGDERHPWYRYGGMWKNKHAGVSAKRKGRKGKRGKDRENRTEEVEEWREGRRYVRNDRVVWEGRVWGCRRGHVSEEGCAPKGEGRGAGGGDRRRN